MYSFMEVAAFVCLACAGWLLVPRLIDAVQRLVQSGKERFGGPPASYLPLVESGRGKRRVPLSSVLLSFGKLMPPSRKSAVDAAGKPKSEQMIYTGSRVSVQEFTGLRVLAALAGCFAGFIILQEIPTLSPAVIPVVGAVGFLLPGMWLKSRIKTRERSIIRLLPEVIDLLTLCIGAGLDFLMALNKVVALPRFKREPLVEELSAAMQEIKFGKRRSEALRSMAKRLNLSELSSFVRAVVQADRMGTPIAEVLAIHSVDVRSERMVKAERMALKAPIKILFPLIFFIMPCVAIVVGGPVILQFPKQGNPFNQVQAKPALPR